MSNTQITGSKCHCPGWWSDAGSRPVAGANSALMGMSSIPGLPVLIAAGLMLCATLLAWAKARPGPALEPQAA